MLGAIIGDIIGSRFEFDNHKSKDFALFGNDGIREMPCTFTDDTVMTVAVADALLEFKSIEDDEVFKSRLIGKFYDYGDKYPDCAFGYRFHHWLVSHSAEPYYSYGNGSAMRVSPAGWYADSLDEAEHLAKLTAEVTHNHPEGITGAQSVAAAIWMARNGSSKSEIKNYIEEKYYPIDFYFSLDDIRPHYEFDETCRGTVPVAFMSFFESTDFEDSIRNAISVGGDSDTLAAITGAIAEAFYGIPDRIREKALRYLDAEMKKVVGKFVKTFLHSLTEAI